MADCIVTMNLGHGADIITRSKVRVRRLERGDNGEYVVAAGWSDVPTGRPFTTWTGEQGVVYQVDEQGGIPGGVMRTVELPADAEASYSDLVDVVPLPAGPGVLGDQVIATALSTPGSASNDILVETIAADPTIVDAAEAALLGAGLDAATATLVATDGTALQEEVIAQNATLRPDGLTYNSDDTIATSTEGGITTTYTWNADGTINTEERLGKTKTYTYDGSGRLTGSAVA